MKKAIILAAANTHKHKGQTLSLLLLSFIAAMLLNLGLLTAIKFEKSFYEKSEELNAPHAVVAAMKNHYQNSFKEYFEGYPGITEISEEEILFLPAAKFRYGDGIFSNIVMVLNADRPRSMLGLSFVGEHTDPGEDSIYVSYLLKSGGGYSLGDSFVLSYGHKDHHFKISGFIEDTFLGSINMSGIGFYLPANAYSRLEAELSGNGAGVMLSARLQNPEDSSKLISGINNMVMSSAGSFFYSTMWNADFNLAKYSRTFTASIIAILILAFSIIVTMISLIVTTFRIRNSIDESMTNIGVLKAMGYTSSQIISSIVLQFTLITALGSLLGIWVSFYAITPLSHMLSAQTGLIWRQCFNAGISFLSLFALTLGIGLVSLLSAGKIHRLHPIYALRGGISTHSFRKNYFPLQRTWLNLHLVLSLKMLIQNAKQNLLITLIIATVSFASVFSLVLYYNIVIENQAFIHMVSGEQSNAVIIKNPDNHDDKLIENIRQIPGVRKAIYFDTVRLLAGDEKVAAYVVEDFSLTENDMIYKGRYPKHPNEITIGGHVSKLLNKHIGDTIQIKTGNIQQDYLVTGLHQNPNNFGMDITLTYEGMIRLQPDYLWSTIYMYANKDVDTNAVIRSINERYGNMIAETIDIQELMNSSLGVFMSIATMVTLAINVITALVMSLMLYLVIRTLLLKNRKYLGIQKAIGYTTIELVQQVSMAYLPIMILGTAIGGITGYLGVNPLFALLLRKLGVMKANFYIMPGYVILLCVLIIGFAYGLSMWISSHIRKISPYGLIHE